MAAKPPKFHPDTGPTVQYLAEVLDELMMESNNHGATSGIGGTCSRAFDCLWWLARDYMTPEHLRHD